MKAILISLTILISSFNIITDNNDLVGKWKCYHKELEDGTTEGTDYINGGKFTYSCDDLIIELKSDMTGWESQGELTFPYERQDSILKLGNRFYIIELLNSEELTLLEYKPNGLSFGNFRQKYKKIK